MISLQNSEDPKSTLLSHKPNFDLFNDNQKPRLPFAANDFTLITHSFKR